MLSTINIELILLAPSRNVFLVVAGAMIRRAQGRKGSRTARATRRERGPAATPRPGAHYGGATRSVDAVNVEVIMDRWEVCATLSTAVFSLL